MISLALLLLSVAIIAFATGAALERCGCIKIGPYDPIAAASARRKIARSAPGEFVELTPAEMDAVRYMVVPAPPEVERHVNWTS